MKTTIVVSGCLWFWDSHESCEYMKSIPQYVEEHADRLRAKFLAFIYNLGESVLENKRLVEHLNVGSTYSLWWMSLLTEKSLYKSPRIVDCLRLLALEEILQEKVCGYVELCGGDFLLKESVEVLCGKIGFTFSWRQSIRLNYIHNLRQFKYKLLQPIGAIAWFICHILTCWQQRSGQSENWNAGESTVFICSYFDNLDPKSCRKGCFQSYFWGGFPNLLEEIGLRSNWLHFFVSTQDVPNPRIGTTWLNGFNNNIKDQGKHAFLGSYLSVISILKIILIWLKTYWFSLRTPELKFGFQPKSSNAWFWPLLKNDWYASTRGIPAIQNTLWIELFDTAMKTIPHQRLGFYLYEGQGWESAFVSAWRKHGHGKLVAVAHSTIRFWDMRYFNDPRVFTIKDNMAMPQPDFIAINGPVAWQALINAGYDAKQLRPVEALRYLKLKSMKKKHKPRSITERGRSLLLLGDYDPENTDVLFQTLKALPADILNSFNISVKPHPNSPIHKDDYHCLAFELTNEPLSEILNQFDIIYAANPTSAALDAYIFGLSVIVQLDDGRLNCSPLRGIPWVDFVSNISEFMIALQKSLLNEPRQSEQYFWLDEELQQWRNLCLGLN